MLGAPSASWPQSCAVDMLCGFRQGAFPLCAHLSLLQQRGVSRGLFCSEDMGCPGYSCTLGLEAQWWWCTPNRPRRASGVIMEGRKEVQRGLGSYLRGQQRAQVSVAPFFPPCGSGPGAWSPDV